MSLRIRIGLSIFLIAESTPPPEAALPFQPQLNFNSYSRAAEPSPQIAKASDEIEVQAIEEPASQPAKKRCALSVDPAVDITFCASSQIDVKLIDAEYPMAKSKCLTQHENW